MNAPAALPPPFQARAQTRARPGRRWLWALVGLLGAGYLLALAVGPRVPEAVIARDRLWLENERFGGPFGVSLNGDSLFYMIDAEDTRKVFLPAARLQSRPLLSFLAHPFAKLVERLDLPRPARASYLFNSLLPQYVVFVGFNLLMVVATYLAFLRLVARHAAAPAPPVSPPNRDGGAAGSSRAAAPVAATAALLGLLLVSNDVTKAFFYAAHAQMLNLLVPVLAVLAFAAFGRAGARGRDAALVCLLAGLGMLAYGGFAVLGVGVAAAWLWRGRRRPDRPGAGAWPRARLGAQLLGLLLLLAAPYAGWVGLVRALTGGFYSHETAYWGEVVWMADAAAAGWDQLAASLLFNAWFFLRATLRHWGPALLLVPVLGWLSWPQRREVRARLARSRPLLAGCAVVGVAFWGLFTLVGYRVERLAMPQAVVGLLALAAWAQALEPLLPPARRRFYRLGVGVFVAAQMAWTVLKDGPYL